MANRIALIVSELIETKEEVNTLYQVYRVKRGECFDNVIKRALQDGCKEVLAFATEEFELCGVKSKNRIQTFVTKCNGAAAEFYVNQAKQLIKAQLDFSDMITTLKMSLKNSAYSMMMKYQLYVK